MPFLKVNSANLYYEEHGSGAETVVFGHSLMFNCRMFDDQVNALKDRYRCVTFDFRGQGQSEVTANGYDMETLTEDAVAIIQQLDCAPCHYLGFSMGGFVGLRLAMRHTELLKSLILVDTSAEPEPADNLPKYKLLNFVARWIGLWAVSSQVMPIMFSESFLNDPTRADLSQEWKQHLLNNDKKGITRAVNGVITRKGVADSLDDIHLPTLILVGENDIATTPDKAERLHGGIQDSQLITIPHAGHMSPVEEPAAVNAAINDFLASLS